MPKGRSVGEQVEGTEDGAWEPQLPVQWVPDCSSEGPMLMRLDSRACQLQTTVLNRKVTHLQVGGKVIGGCGYGCDVRDGGVHLGNEALVHLSHA